MHTPPVILGVLWAAIVVTCTQPEINSKESHQVYSYTYHFQHNGTTDPKSIIQSLLADTPDGGNVVKTFSNPHIRGFVSKGFLPSGPIGFNSLFKTRNPALEGIKKIVEKNFQELDRPIPPPESIPIPQPGPERYPGVDLEVNNLLSNVNDRFKRIQDRFPNIPNRNNLRSPVHTSRQVVDNNVVTRVQEFERDIPNGKVYQKIETYMYNPPPISNAISNTENLNGGVRHTQEVRQQNRRNFGERTVSFFKKEYRTNIDGGNSFDSRLPPVDFSRHDGPQINHNINKENLGNLLNINVPQQHQRQPEPHVNNEIRRQQHQRQPELHVNNEIRRQQHQRHPEPHVNNEIRRQQLNNVNEHNINNQPRQINWNSHRITVPRQRSNFQQGVNDNHNNFPNANIGSRVDAIINNVNNRISRVHEQLNNVNNHERDNFKWDDRSNWKSHSDWGKRLPQGTNHAKPENRRPFSNGHSGPVVNQDAITNVNPISVDALRSTLEALVGAKVDIPTFPVDQGNGNFHHGNAGGIERVFHVDRVFEGPNSYGRNLHRGFERNFQVDSNTGYQRSNQWSTNTVRRLDAQSTRDDFSKDFIDVFNDGN